MPIPSAGEAVADGVPAERRDRGGAGVGKRGRFPEVTAVVSLTDDLRGDQRADTGDREQVFVRVSSLQLGDGAIHGVDLRVQRGDTPQRGQSQLSAHRLGSPGSQRQAPRPSQGHFGDQHPGRGLESR